jgi:hypothetical protein
VVRGGAREREASISEDAFEELVQSFRTWLGTRMLRHHERTGRGAHNIAVDGDGQHGRRAAGARR